MMSQEHSFTLKLEEMVRDIKQTAIDFSQCLGIFLCTDDRDLKAGLGNILEKEGFTVCTYATDATSTKLGPKWKCTISNMVQ